MLELRFSNGEVFVYNVNDWIVLRKSYRIIGELVGNTSCIPALPVKLLPEEVVFLLDKGVAKVIKNENTAIPETNKKKYEDFEAEVLYQQQQSYKNIRKRQLETMIDDIVAAKRKRGDSRSSDEILNEELEKSSKVTGKNLIWPIFLTPLISSDNLTEISRDVILNNTSELKCRIFKDLWDKGYYVTLGHKFGGDFLVYLGDPVIYHAVFIVRCVDDPNKSINTTEIVAFGRLGTSVKKRAVLASIDEKNNVSYITINWIDA